MTNPQSAITNHEGMPKHARIYVAGHQGLVGSALMRCLRGRGYENLIVRTHKELDLTDEHGTQVFFQDTKPEYVFLAAAKAGGIYANSTYPAEFIHENLAIQTNVIHQAWSVGVKRLLFLGSSCIYPRDCPQPIKEEYLLTGPLEPTNRAYALAKIAGIEMCWSYNRQYSTQFLAAMPTNLYGSGDNYDLERSHVIPALIRKFHEAKVATESPAHSSQSSVVIWGTGTPRREFLYSDDAAEACIFLMNLPDEEFKAIVADENLPPLINIGSGEDLTIRELVDVVADVIGFRGDVNWDRSKPDGTPRKLLDVSKLTKRGWQPQVGLRQGVEWAYKDYLSNIARHQLHSAN